MELKDVMNVLPVTIERFVNDDFPSCVECVLVDSEECSHRFVEKAPVVTTANLLLDSAFPQPGHIACVVEDEWIDKRGRQLVRVSTTNPWGIESTTANTTFTVVREQIEHV
jgi:hypothetical protein